MQILKSLRVKPWLPVEFEQQTSQATGLLNKEKAASTALHFLLAVITVIFFLFTVTFLQRTQSFDFQALSGEPWLPFTNAEILWQNSAYLLLASISIMLAKKFAERQSLSAIMISLAATTLFTLLFISGQIQVWLQLNQSGFYITTNPANSYYFLLTGVHALHIIGGILVFMRCILLFAVNRSYQQLVSRLKLCARYWHYLFFIWLFLFFLLTSDADTFKTIASICGF
ncbi:MULTISPECIES: cytochrome c oxidase subunit 3 [Colwellia]|uniref:Cytochrome-c oxidase n=1 Tax=Colwellia marinimaniae TaxID=1513592 RepID=A0ABQ0MU03_9GAMM|nr:MULTISPECIES: cytochrome c oxidase subunit 3 [Colwellia]GAW95858.1 cytochrome-c oxidase [Colwellia marinimaniae]